MRSLMATLLFSQGVPMIVAGDEMGRTQSGNNNAYCQDNEISWIHWDLDDAQHEQLRFTQRVIQILQSQPALRRRRFFHGQAIQGSEAPDIAWLNPSGDEMSDEEWRKVFVRCLGVQLDGEDLDFDEEGEQISGDTLLLLFNADHANDIPFTLPELDPGEHWQRLLDTADTGATTDSFAPGMQYPLKAVSVALLRVQRIGESATLNIDTPAPSRVAR
jgi:glycogen operon protein